jgi:hypothetical protein
LRIIAVCLALAACNSILGIGDVHTARDAPTIIDAPSAVDAPAASVDGAPVDGAMAIDARAVCGDGVMTAPEACDDGNTVTETACAYGTATCSACNADCSAVLHLTGNVCNDGVRDPTHEVCDDGSPVACPPGFVGTRQDCNPDCQGMTTVTCTG